MAPKGQEKWLLSSDVRQDANTALGLTLGKASTFSSEHMDEQNGPVTLNAGWIYKKMHVDFLLLYLGNIKSSFVKILTYFTEILLRQ